MKPVLAVARIAPSVFSRTAMLLALVLRADQISVIAPSIPSGSSSCATRAKTRRRRDEARRRGAEHACARYAAPVSGQRDPTPLSARRYAAGGKTVDGVASSFGGTVHGFIASSRIFGRAQTGILTTEQER
jgi:hypothetical protein